MKRESSYQQPHRSPQDLIARRRDRGERWDLEGQISLSENDSVKRFGCRQGTPQMTESLWLQDSAWRGVQRRGRVRYSVRQKGRPAASLHKGMTDELIPPARSGGWRGGESMSYLSAFLAETPQPELCRCFEGKTMIQLEKNEGYMAADSLHFSLKLVPV